MQDRRLVAPNHTMARHYGELHGIDRHNTIADSPMPLRGVSKDVVILVIDSHLLSKETLQMISMLEKFGNRVHKIESLR